jgi:benzylsuccinate CoA-transferase BbsE subunit
MGGIMTLAGDPADPPNILYGNQADISASIQAAQGAMLALLHAEATGEGQLVDVSAQESVSMSQETAMQYWDLQHRNRVRTGASGGLGVHLPALGPYETRDGYVSAFVLAPAGADFPELVAWMDEHDMAGPLKEEPYRTFTENLNMRYLTQLMADPGAADAVRGQLDVIDEQIKAFMASLPAVEAYEEGQKRKLLIGLVSTPKDIAENNQLRARNWFRNLDIGGKTVEFPGAPYRLLETPVEITPPPKLGEHTERVLAALG